MDWDWFRSAVELRLEPMLQQYGLHRLTGKAYEFDEEEWGKGDAFFYAHPSDERPFLTIDLLKWNRFEQGKQIDFYWLRVETWNGQLNRQTSNTPDLENFVGWIFYQRHELEPILQEVVGVLEAHLSQLG